MEIVDRSVFRAAVPIQMNPPAADPASKLVLGESPMTTMKSSLSADLP